MTQNAPIPALAKPDPQAAEIDPSLGTGESFWNVVLRRSRYIAAIAAAAALFLYFAWPVIAPPPERAGVTLMAWNAAAGAGAGQLLAAAVIAALLILAILIAMFLCHPDAPHIGIYCAFLGLAGIAIRGGTIQTLIYDGQIGSLLGRAPDLATYHKLLALECVQWAVLIILCEIATRLLYDRVFANIRWMNRSGLSQESVQRIGHKVGGSVGGIAVSIWLLALTRKTGDKKPNRILQNLTALLATALVATVLLPVFMQSEAKGQVLFALYISFALAGAAGRAAAPHCEPWALMLAVPITAAAGYLSATTRLDLRGVYPGVTPSALARALPIDYICAGVPAVIFGYYTAFRIQFQHALEQE